MAGILIRSLELSTDHSSVGRGVTEGDVTRYAIPKQEPLVAEHEAFRDMVLGHSHRNASLHDGLHAVLASLQASRSGATTAVPSLIDLGAA